MEGVSAGDPVLKIGITSHCMEVNEVFYLFCSMNLTSKGFVLSYCAINSGFSVESEDIHASYDISHQQLQ